MIMKYGPTNLSTPKPELSLTKVNHLELLPVATKTSPLGVVEILHVKH